MTIARSLFKFFSSLKLAVISLVLLAGILAVATVVESRYGTRAAWVAVYGTAWFGGVLFLLGLNVLCAALSRYPWKPRQTGFVITHIGIIVILIGSFLTQRLGVDGNLPIYEKSADNEVILNDLSLSLIDEKQDKKQEFKIRESVNATTGKMFSVPVTANTSLVVDGFIPRAVLRRKFEPSQAQVGGSAIKVELYNERFHIAEWIYSTHPGLPSKINLGPAELSLTDLWELKDLKTFQNPPKTKDSGIGLIVLSKEGRDFRVPITVSRSWSKVGSGGLEIRIDRYLPYAIVDKNKLVNRNNDPVNPAVEFTLRLQGKEEQHTVFANFPEFATIHGAGKKDGGLGYKARMLSLAAPKKEELGMVGASRGELQFATLPGRKGLTYRALGKTGSVNASGEVEVDKEYATGWMDLKFRVSEYIPYAVEKETPDALDYITGPNDSYTTAIHLSEEKNGITVPNTGMWMLENSARMLSFDGREVTITFSKNRMTLPFKLYLEKFFMGTDPGTQKAASYQSTVSVKETKEGEQKSTVISMNEPLHYGGYTFYQASYQLQEGKPAISVFAVNYDPGRWVKYIGSLILCLGIGIMFWMNPHYFDILVGKKAKS